MEVIMEGTFFKGSIGCRDKGDGKDNVSFNPFYFKKY